MIKTLNKEKCEKIIKKIKDNPPSKYIYPLLDPIGQYNSIDLQLKSLSSNNADTSYDILVRIEESKKGFVLYNLKSHSDKNSKRTISSVLKYRKFHHLYIRQSSSDKRNYVMLDDLNKDSVYSLFRYGICPCLITETSKGSYQAILRFPENVSIIFIERVHFILKCMFKSDMLCDYSDNFTRLVSSINHKEKYKDTDSFKFETRIVYFNKTSKKTFYNWTLLRSLCEETINTPVDDQPEIRKELIVRKFENYLGEF